MGVVSKFFTAFVFILTFNTVSAQDKINWLTVTEMQAAMQKEPRKVFIDVYTVWCGPCKMMMSQTFTDPKIIAYVNENYYAVKFNAEGNESITFNGRNYINNSFNPANSSRRNGTHEFTKAIAPVNGKIAYPTLVYMDEDFQIISPVQGFWKAPQLLPLLHFINEEVYKTQTSFQDYSEGF